MLRFTKLCRIEIAEAMNPRLKYTDKNSVQTLREGLEEYYAMNEHLTLPDTQPVAFAKILRAHDVGHIIYGCDTGMYDELRLLPLFWWTSECTFERYLEMRNSPVVDVMYADLIKERGALWLYSSILFVLPRLLPELLSMWLKTRHRQIRVPFLEFESLLDCSLLEIRQKFDLLPLIK